MNARRKADKAGVKLTAIRSGYQEFDFGAGKWDLIVMTYAYFPISDAVYVNRLVGSMRPGGLLAFQHGVLKKGVDRSGTAPLLGIPEEGELKEIFRSLVIVRYEEVEEESDWQVSHGHRMGRTVKMLAEKPSAKQFWLEGIIVALPKSGWPTTWLENGLAAGLLCARTCRTSICRPRACGVGKPYALAGGQPLVRHLSNGAVAKWMRRQR
jgi:hypothetical protein